MLTLPHWLSLPDRHIAISSRPRGGEWLNDEIRSWREAGVDIVVSALEDHEAAELILTEEPAHCRAMGIEFRSFPIRDRDTPPSPQALLPLVTQLVADMRKGCGILVHCRAGIGRSGLITACLLCADGMSPAQAFNSISAARGLVVPDTDAQKAWVGAFIAYYAAPERL